MSTTNLAMTELVGGQNMPEVSHNAALHVIDTLMFCAVVDEQNAPPGGSPADGLVYLIGSSPSGAWTGHAGKLAMYYGGAITPYLAPKEGFVVWLKDENRLKRYDGSSWVYEPVYAPAHATGSLPSVTSSDVGRLAWDTTTNTLKGVRNDGTWVNV